MEPTSNSPRNVSSDNSRRTDTSSRPFKPPKVLANKLIKSKVSDEPLSLIFIALTNHEEKKKTRLSDKFSRELNFCI